MSNWFSKYNHVTCLCPPLLLKENLTTPLSMFMYTEPHMSNSVYTSVQKGPYSRTQAGVRPSRPIIQVTEGTEYRRLRR